MTTPAPAPAPPPPPAAPAKSGSRTIIIILCVLGAVFLLMGGCVAGCTYYAAKKAKAYSAQVEKNPAYATVSLMASLHPGIEVLSKDEATGKITLRNKSDGKEVTLDTTQYTAESISNALEKFARGALATVEEASSHIPSSAPDDPATTNAAVATLPAYLPAYPGALTLSAGLENAAGVQVTEYAAESRDQPKAIVEFYQTKLLAAGFQITSTTVDTTEATLDAAAAGPTRTASVYVAPAETEGRFQIELTFTQMPK